MFDSDFVDFIAGLLAVCTLVLVATGALVSAAYAVTDSRTCTAQYPPMGLTVKWGFWSGCMVKQGTNYEPVALWVQSHVPHQLDATVKDN